MNQVPQNQQEINIQELFQIINRRKLTILCFVLIFGIVGTIYSFSQTPVFETEAIVLIGTKTPDTFTDKTKGFEELDPTKTDYYKTQYAMLKSRTLAKRIIDDLNLVDSNEFKAKPPLIDLSGIKQTVRGLIENLIPAQPENAQAQIPKDPVTEMVDDFLRRLIISPITQSHVVNVSFQGYNPVLITEITNKFLDTVIQRNIERRTQILGGSEKWMVEKLTELKEKMKRAEQKLAKFRKRNNIIDFRQNREISAQNLSKYQDEIRTVQTEQLRLQTLKELLEKLKRDPLGLLQSLPDDVKTIEITNLITQYAQIVSEYEDLTSQYSVRHPRLQLLEQKKKQIEQKIPAEVNSLIASIDIDYRGTVVHEESLRNAMQTEKNKIMKMDNEEFTFNALNDEFETNKILHNDLLKRFKEIDIASYSNESAIQVVDRAEIPYKPIKPKKTFIISLCLMLGVLGGSFWTIVSERMKKSMISVEDVVRQIPFPFLGAVGVIGKKDLPLPAVNNINSFVAEEFRTVKTNLMLNGFIDQNKALLISSSTPKEGKTTIVTNLAATFAQENKRVLIIDADFVRPKVSSVFTNLNTFKHPGFIDVLENPKLFDRLVNHKGSENGKLDEIYLKTGIDGVYILPRGALTRKFTDTINYGLFQKFLTAVKKTFDVVLIDTPPALAFSYVSVAAQLCDGVMFVIGSGMKDKDLIKRTLKQLSAASSDNSFRFGGGKPASARQTNGSHSNSNNMLLKSAPKSRIFGVVLNKVKFHRDDYYEYHRKYFQDYYSNMDLKKRKVVSA